MPRMPGSPRPDAKSNDGVYRSLFQQPHLEIPVTAPSSSWFEFLLHPDALQLHLQTLRHQNERGTHGATSAIELVRDFLDQAQLVADEGNGRNNRYRALLKLAAQVALQMEMSLPTIEEKLAPHFQRLLLNGILDFAQSDAAQTELITASQALRLHQRWTLRTLVRESQNGYLTSTAKSDAEEQVSGFQVALSELAERHVEIAQSLQTVLADDGRNDIAPQTQFDAFYDLAVYFFSFSSYERAYECFSRALEVVEDHSDQLTDVTSAVRASLEGYLAACEAVLEAKSIADGKASVVPQVAIDESFAAGDCDRVLTLLQEDVVADSTSRCPPGYRGSMELQALRLVREFKQSNNGGVRALRRMYKCIVICNAVDHVVHSDRDSRVLEGVGSCARLFHEEELLAASEQHGPSGSLFRELVTYTLTLCERIVCNDSSRHEALRQFLIHLTNHVPRVGVFESFSRQLRSLGVVLDPPSQRVNQGPAVESRLRSGARRQRQHFRVANDLLGYYSPQSRLDGVAQSRDCSASANEVRRAILKLVDGTSLPRDHGGVKNLVGFLMLHACWDALQHWRSLCSQSEGLVPVLLDFAIVCGHLMQQVTASTHVSSADPTKPTFSVTRCNKIVSDLLAYRRSLLSLQGLNVGEHGDVSGGGGTGEIAILLVDLPLWMLEAVVCVCAGLLHRSSMRSLSDHRVSFDLNPYGDLALLVAFAPDTPKKKGADETTQDPSLHVATASFLRNALPEIVSLHARGVQCLVQRCPREPRWQSAYAELVLYPIVKLKQPSLSDPRAALCGYLSAASLATNFFSDDAPMTDIIDQSSLVRLSQCLVKVGAHVAAAVPYQCFAPDEFKYGQRILQIAPDSHNPAFFQYFWELPFLELLVHLHSNPKHFNNKYVTLLTHLIQSPELNSSNPASIQKSVEHRILRCYFRDLCRMFL